MEIARGREGGGRQGGRVRRDIEGGGRRGGERGDGGRRRRKHCLRTHALDRRQPISKHAQERAGGRGGGGGGRGGLLCQHVRARGGRQRTGHGASICGSDGGRSTPLIEITGAAQNVVLGRQRWDGSLLHVLLRHHHRHHTALPRHCHSRLAPFLFL